MVKITFQPVSVQKPEKESDGDKIIVPQAHGHPVLPVRAKKPFPTGLCCLTFGLVIFMSGLVLASVYIYRYYFIPQQVPEDSLFHCRVVYEDSVYAPLRGRQELEENVGIYLEDNYEQISVPVPHFGGSDPADIIHDFQRGLTAYHDIALDKCYITELNTTLVMPPRNLWELLVNVKVRPSIHPLLMPLLKIIVGYRWLFRSEGRWVPILLPAVSDSCVSLPQRGTYLPQTYIIQEEMVVTGRVRNMRQLGPFIHRLCFGKETYRLRRRNQRRRKSTHSFPCLIY
uniref:Integral membrane protein 2 n=1 Tax=Echeneis naucrates TaxID=173247 RepID=A0A665TIM3_ECHNA